VSHAVLHVPVVRRRLASPHRDLLLARVRRGSIPAYRDPEWQAWALAGCILMPRRTVKMLPDRSLSSLAHIYGVSEEFAQSHLRRLKVEVVE
jgi:Zn-dependent peptidase ImmA (M78 family)